MSTTMVSNRNHSISNFAPSSKSITSSALVALPPQTTVPLPSTANAPASCHLLPNSVNEPFSAVSSTTPRPFLGSVYLPAISLLLLLLLCMAPATRSPSQPVSFHD